MAKFIVLKDIAILDRGRGEENRFVAIDGVSVDEYGALSARSLQSAKRALSNEAVRAGATRIHESNCVDIDSGGSEASDDMVVAYNGGDIVYTSLQSGFAIEKFMIMNYLLMPATKFQVPRISVDGQYPAASPHDVLETAEEIVRFLPSPSLHEAREIIEMILRESRVVYFTHEDVEAVLRLLV
jgi:hypothetical protein